MFLSNNLKTKHLKTKNKPKKSFVLTRNRFSGWAGQEALCGRKVYATTLLHFVVNAFLILIRYILKNLVNCLHCQNILHNLYIKTKQNKKNNIFLRITLIDNNIFLEGQLDVICKVYDMILTHNVEYITR